MRCHKRFVGRANYFYPAILIDQMPWRQRAVLCTDCFMTHMEWVREHMTLVEEDTPYREEDTDADGCVICSDQVVPRVPMFVTTYKGKDVRDDWFAEVCLPHANDVVEALGYPPL